MNRARARASLRTRSSVCRISCARVIIWLNVPRFSSRSQRSIEESAHAISHFSRRIAGVGEGQDFVWLRMTVADQMFDAMGEDGGLAGARSGNYQHRAVDMLNRLALTLVGNERTGTRLLGRHYCSG